MFNVIYTLAQICRKLALCAVPCIALLLPSLSHAQTWCLGGSTVTLSPALDLTHMPYAAGTVYTGTMTVVATQCSANFYITADFGTVARATSISGLSVALSGAKTYSVESGNCVLNATNGNGWSDGSITSIFYQGSARCDVTANFPIVITKTAGNSAGTLTSTTLDNATYSKSSNLFPKNWAAMAQSGIGWVGLTTGPGTYTVATLSCTVSTPNITVTLPTVGKSALTPSGSVAGRMLFTVTLNGCGAQAASYVASATWSFTPGPSSTIVSSSGAANVGVQLLDSTLAPIANGASTTIASIPAAGGGPFSQTFYAQYISFGTPGSGSVSSTATFTMSYL